MDIMLLLVMSAMIIVPIWLIYKLIKGASLEKLLKTIIIIIILPIAFFVLASVLALIMPMLVA